MSPSDEKHPAVGMSSSADANKSAPAPLQNPLHQMYNAVPGPAGGGSAVPAASQAESVRSPLPATQQPGAGGLLAQTQNSATPHHAASIADEQAWVEQTKAVIEQTQNDPYKRMQLLQQLRASYLAERFNRHTNETSSS